MEMEKISSRSNFIELLWQSGFFKEPKYLSDVSKAILEKWEHHLSPSEANHALRKSLPFLRRSGKKGSYKYIQKFSSTSKRVESVEEELFSKDLIKKFGKSFETEVRDLHLNFRTSGTCTAFLLRKILEKAIYIVFAKHGLESKLGDKSKVGYLVGLEAMVNIASIEKIGGIPILNPKTAKQIQGIKFLGDTSAHHPLVNVDMETILPQMPFIITAYKELAERLV